MMRTIGLQIYQEQILGLQLQQGAMMMLIVFVQSKLVVQYWANFIPELCLCFMCVFRGDNRSGRGGLGRAGPTVGRAKTGPSQNWPGFFGPKF